MTPSTRKPGEPEPDDHMCSEPVGDDGLVVCQEPVGDERVVGGGEFPDKDRKPDDAAPGGDPDTGSTHEDIEEEMSGPPPGGSDPMTGEAPTG